MLIFLVGIQARLLVCGLCLIELQVLLTIFQIGISLKLIMVNFEVSLLKMMH